MQAKYYIYRNLHTGGFSVRYRGRVVDRLNTFTAMDITFRVSESGRRKVVNEGRKNVHAFVVADKYKGTINKTCELDKLARVKYNPYTDTQFMCEGDKIYKAKMVAFKEGRCFLVE